MRAVVLSLLVAAVVPAATADAEGCASLAARWFGGPSADAVIVRPGVGAVDTGTAITLVDLTDVARPLGVGQVDLGERSVGLASVAGGLVASTADGRLVIVDAADPRRPVVTATMSNLGRPAAVAAAGDLVAVAEHGAGVRLIDVSVPSDPRQITLVDTPGAGGGVSVTGSRVLVADGWAGVAVIVVRDPNASPEIARVPLPGRTIAVAADGALAVARTDEPAMWVLDLSVPGGAAAVASIPLTGSDGRVALADGRAVVESGPNLVFVDISDAARPTVTARASKLGRWRLVGSTHDAVLAVDTILGGLVVYDASDPNAPRRAGEFFPPFPPARPALVGDRAVVLGVLGELRLIDLADAEHPSETAILALPHDQAFEALHAVGHTVLALSGSRLAVVDVTPSGALDLLGWLDVGQRMRDLAAYGAGALVSGSGTITTLDVGRPTEPRVVAVHSASASWRVALSAGRAATGGGRCLQMMAIDDSGRADLRPPDCLGFGDASIFSLAMEADTLAVAMDGRGFRLMDVSDVAAPDVLLEIDQGGHRARSCDLAAGYAAIGWDDRGWSVVDVRSAAGAHEVVRERDVGGRTVQLEGDRLITTGADGLSVFDLSQCADGPPVADFESVSGWSDDRLTFALVSRTRGLASALEWRLSDGTTATGPVVHLELDGPTILRVSLTATNLHGADTVERVVWLGRDPLREPVPSAPRR